MFPSPYGAWVSSKTKAMLMRIFNVSVPLRGMGFICGLSSGLARRKCFRPLTGHGFHRATCYLDSNYRDVSVPLLGMGFIGKNAYAYFNIKTHC